MSKDNNSLEERMKCVERSSETKDGIYISGHTFIPLVAIQDRDSSRWYFVDRCEDCGHIDVCFSENDSEVKHYPEIRYVGGSAQELTPKEDKDE